MGKLGKVFRVYNSDQTEWVDVLRLTDLHTQKSAVANVGEQDEYHELHWTNGRDEVSREYDEIEIPFPAGYVTANPTVKLNAIRNMRMIHNSQEEFWQFRNEDANKNRKVSYIRVYKSSATADEAGVDWDSYKGGIDAVDRTYHIDVPVYTDFRQYTRGIDRTFHFVNDDIISRFEEASSSAIYHDPFQVIVNASFLQNTELLFRYAIFKTQFSQELDPDLDVAGYFRYLHLEDFNVNPDNLIQYPVPYEHAFYAQYYTGFWNFILNPVYENTWEFYGAYKDDGSGAEYAAVDRDKFAVGSSVTFPLALYNVSGQYAFDFAWFETGPGDFFLGDFTTGFNEDIGDRVTDLPPGDISNDWNTDAVHFNVKPPVFEVKCIASGGSPQPWGAFGTDYIATYYTIAVPKEELQVRKLLSNQEFLTSISYDGKPMDILGYRAVGSYSNADNYLHRPYYFDVYVLARIVDDPPPP